MQVNLAAETKPMAALAGDLFRLAVAAADDIAAINCSAKGIFGTKFHKLFAKERAVLIGLLIDEGEGELV